MSLQDDERLAKKLLDLSSRSSRVEVRNGMTYLDGFALGNGTVEIRSQVARDRRRRFIPESSVYAAAILYEVVNSTNSEVWLQDDEAAPVLITTLPQRLTLDWSVYVPGNAEEPDSENRIIRLGYLLRTVLSQAKSLSPQDVFNDTASSNQGSNIRLSNTNGGTRVRYGDLAPVLDFGNVGTFWLRYATATAGASSELLADGLFNVGTGGTVSIETMDNQLSTYLQRRQGGTYIYLRHQPYRSQNTPTPNLTTGDVWLNAQYWVDGTLSTGSITPAPGDITGSVLGNPLRQLLIISDTESPYNGIALSDGRNLYSTTESISVSDLSAFLTTEENGGTAEVSISVARNGGTPVVSNQQFPCAPANARQILSVAVYPRG